MINEKNLKLKGLNLSNSTTNTAFGRKNLVTIENMAKPETDINSDWNHTEIDQIVDKIVEARKNDRPVIWSMGAHVIKCGLSRYVIKLLKKGIITHVAGNGAVSIHDFELAYLGGTSEYVPRAIEDGSFGMWEETGLWMNEAIKEGFELDLGYGASLAKYIDENLDRFPYREDCVVYQAYKLGIPATYHISIGTDIIHQHPSADFKAFGSASGIDFSIYCHSISQLEGGVFLNFGSAVIGPEVFLKALAISRNQGYDVSRITTVNFDIIPLGDDYRSKIGKNKFLYFYRPRKNIVNRPTTLGGRGYYIEANHKNSIPNLYSRILARFEGENNEI